MEIKKVNGYEAQAVQRATEQQQTRRVSEESAPGKEVASGSDQVRLSSRYQEVAQVRKVMMEREELRSERVDHLRNMIENKSYAVDPEKTAQRMLEELW
jgi:negative regulator of flagellin synthesis FlgM